MRSIPWYGWVRDLPDRRDWKYTLGVTRPMAAEALPEAVDLRSTGFLPPVFDQKTLGACTANALAAQFFYVDKKQGGLAFLPSRLFIYYNERAMEGTVNFDCGAQIRDGIKTIVNQGACVEALWPYQPEQFAVAPPDICYQDALRHQATVYRSVAQTPADIQGCLAEGYPITVGIAVFNSFESHTVAQTGVAGLPVANDAPVGGHAVLLVGYTPDCYILQNSWGSDWGMGGFFTLPQAYLHDPGLAADFWMVHAVEAPVTVASPS